MNNLHVLVMLLVIGGEFLSLPDGPFQVCHKGNTVMYIDHE